MKLPVINAPSYLSPTGFSEWQTCPYKFYLRRISGQDWVSDPQGMPAAVGSAFDCYLTVEVAKALGIQDDPALNLDILIAQTVEPHNRKDAIPYARGLFDDYLRMGCFSRLLNEGVSEVHPSIKKTVSIGDNEVVLYGKPDFGLFDGTVVESKVNGAFGKGTYPSPGYVRCFYTDGTIKFNHEKRNEFLEDINSDWAQQLAIYTWLQKGILPFRDIKVAVEQVTVSPKGKVAVASIRTKVSKPFQEQLFNSLTSAWRAILTGEIPDPIPTKAVCFKYNSQCVVSSRCSYFKDWQNDPLKDLL